MKRLFIIICIILCIQHLDATERIKDITTIKGISSTSVVGYGLVAGLHNTGDYQRTYFTEQSLKNMLKNFGISIENNRLRSRNVAAVMVVAEIPPFVQKNSRFDITISSIGDAKSLEGGTLLPTELFTLDGSQIGVAQGPLSIGGPHQENYGNYQSRKQSLVGIIPNGGLLKGDIKNEIGEDKIILALKSPDINSARNIADAINRVTDHSALVSSAGSIEVIFPDSLFFFTNTETEEKSLSFEILDPLVTKNKKNAYLSRIMNLEIQTEMSARVVINERTGTIVVGEKVSISPVSITFQHIQLTIDAQAITAQSEKDNFSTLSEAATVSDIARALNKLGATPRDMIGIFQTLKRAGALHAELVIM